MLPLIVATEIQLFLRETNVRFPRRSGIMYTAPPGDYFKYQVYRSAVHRLRHTAVKMARLTNFDRKGVQICFTNKSMTLTIGLRLQLIRFY